jgi:hypothetical protein
MKRERPRPSQKATSKIWNLYRISFQSTVQTRPLLTIAVAPHPEPASNAPLATRPSLENMTWDGTCKPYIRRGKYHAGIVDTGSGKTS